MARKPKSNIDLVKSIMSSSQYGVLAEMFVVDALTKLSKLVAESKLEDYNNSIVNGEAWIGIAKEIKNKLDTFYK